MSSRSADSDLSTRDDTDWRLISLLHADGRASYESLGAEIGLSKVAARTRVKRMLDSGSVRIVGVAHPSLLGMTHFARVSLDTVGPSLPIAVRIAEEVPGVVFVAVSSGPRAVVAEIRVGSLHDIDLSLRALRGIAGVSASDTAIYTEIFRDANIALNRPLSIQPDRTDLQIMTQLQQDGRRSFVELAGVVGASASSIRYRLHRLLDSGALSIQTLVTNAPDDPARQAGFALDVRFDGGFTAHSVLDVSGVIFLAGAVGSADLFGTIESDSLAGIATVIESLRAVPGVVRVRSWVHFQIVRENYDRPLVSPEETISRSSGQS
jgi:DNA-binding Lrp family transcriptional regulator